MRKIFVSIITLVGLIFLNINCFSQTPDPNYYIFLCFGQSNMEGQGPIESQDQNVDIRFQNMSALTCSGPNRTQGTWYQANPPLCRCNTKLSPIDNFGRVMVANLPSNIKIGIVHVAIAGCKIELFDKVNYASYAAGEAQYMKDIIALYGGNPYGRLVEVAKLAQKSGVIKGILMHQGESNTGDNQWPTKVKGVYDNLIKDLGLDATQVPLLAGQVVDAAQGGQCASMNTIINSLPNTISNSYVISSASCTCQSDKLHFTSAGYRILGERYAMKMLSLLPQTPTGYPTVSITSPTATSSFAAPATISIAATAADANGSISKVEFYNGTTLLGTSTTSPYTFNWTNVAAGTYSVTAVATDNSSNKTTSSAITVTVVNAYKIYKTATPITIDGTADAIWNNASVVPASATKLLSGAVTNAADLSGNIKALWDNSNLYVLANVSDDILKNDSQNSYDDDGVEVYVDINNDKATTYGANDVQYTFKWNNGTTVSPLPTGRSTTGITYSFVTVTGGYAVEASIPWSTLQGTPAVNQLVGIDFMINDDDDGTTRDAKLSWNAASDSAWTDPSKMGTGILLDVLTCTPPSAPTVTAALSFCQNEIATALTATGTSLFWYTASTGGTGSTTAPIPSTVTVGNKSYFVSQSVSGCESNRSTITVNVTALPAAPTVITPVSYTQGATATALSPTGTSLKWYSVATGGTALTAVTPSTTVAGTTNYYVSQTINTCESPRAVIAVVVNAPASKISLKVGWNYIGCPVTGSTAIASALSSIWPNVEIVKNLDVYYAMANAPALNTLTTVEWGQGYYVKVSTACDLDWIAR